MSERLLLDSHVLVAFSLGQHRSQYPRIAARLESAKVSAYASTASLWEIAIKVRLGKLTIGGPLDGLARFLLSSRVEIVPVPADHALAALDPEPPSKDPFDRMLLARCAVEGMRLVTVDRHLAGHPLAWREAG